jgi:hypothetical protein
MNIKTFAFDLTIYIKAINMNLKIKEIRVKLKWWEIIIVMVVIYGLLSNNIKTVIELITKLKP